MMHSVNFRPLWFLLLFLVPGMTYAQTQEARIDQILNYDRNKGSIDQNKSFSAEKSFAAPSSNGKKRFSFFPQFSLKSFSGKSYTASKNYWAGEYKPVARNSNFESSQTAQSAQKHFFGGNKAMPVPNGDALGKTYASTKGFEARQIQQERGKRQALLDEEARKGKEMSIDDIRELLNKNK